LAELAIVTGDIFASKCDFLASPVNCIGQTGALAGVFDRKFAWWAQAYRQACRDKTLDLGRPVVHMNPTPDAAPRGVISFATMRYPGSPADANAIREGLAALAADPELSGASIALPALGCGVGGFEFAVLEKMVRASGLVEAANLVELYRPR